MSRRLVPSGAVVVAGLLAARAAHAAGAVVAGEVTVDPPTLNALGFAWSYSGDDDANASVAVDYRAFGSTDWRAAMPLFRVSTRAFAWGTVPPAPRMFAGSIFDLAPDTAYEVRLTLHDPGGGDTTKTLTTRTRKVPSAASVRTLHVIPGAGGGTGTVADPLRGLAAAAAVAKPGDTFVLGAGTYTGSVTFHVDGTETAPIVYRGEDASKVVFDATGNAAWVFDFSGRKYNFLEDVTLVHAKKALRATGATGMVVRGTVMKDFVVGDTANKTLGILADENTNGYLCDNQLLGPEPSVDRDRAGYGPSYDIEIGGTGNVVCHNLMTHWWDAITSSDKCYDTPHCLANDIQDNLFLYATDDAVELDGSVRNVRFLRNRIGSSFDGISVQPAYGGPVYVIRNEVFSSQRAPLKLNPAYAGQDGPSGLVVVHNTFANFDRGFHGGTWDSGWFRNNIVYATQSYAVNDTIMNDVGRGFDFDWDAYHYTGSYVMNLTFLTPEPDVTVRYSLSSLCALGSECHGLSFPSRDAMWVKVPEPTIGSGATTVIFQPGDWDFRLAEGAPAIDVGVRLPNVNDDFVGKAPDLGALEKGGVVPAYGPRGPGSETADGGAVGRDGSPAPAEDPKLGSSSEGGCTCGVAAAPGVGRGWWAMLVVAALFSRRRGRATSADRTSRRASSRSPSR